MNLEVPKYKYYESKIVCSKGQDKALIAEAALKTNEYIKKLDFIMNRFIEDFGSKLDVESKRNQVYFRFTEAKSREYTEATRMTRLLSYYNNGQPLL